MGSKLTLATVSDTADSTRTGMVQATIWNTDQQVSVIYTTPIGSNPVNTTTLFRHAGLFGPPTLGTDILIKKADNSNKWFFDSVPANPVAGLKGGITEKVVETITGNKNPNASLVSIGESLHAFSHAISPQTWGLISPQGNKFVTSDARNVGDREIFAKMESSITQRVLLSSSRGIAVFRNDKGDGIKITSSSDIYKGSFAPRGIKINAFGNIKQVTSHGSMTMKVGSAGTTLDIINRALQGFSQGGTAADNDVGSINIKSTSNDITLKVNNPEGRRIFIDASESEGLVSIKAGSTVNGKGGVEIFSEGDIDINCAGNFNVKAGGNINMKGDNIHLNPDFDTWPGKDSPTNDNQQDAEKSVGF